MRHCAVTAPHASASVSSVPCFSAAFLAQQLSDRAPRVPRFSIPVSRTYGEQIARIVDALSSSRAARTLPPSPPLHSSLGALSGSDVLLVFMESYGSVTYDRPEYAQALQPVRERLAAALQDTGRGVVSGVCHLADLRGRVGAGASEPAFGYRGARFLPL